jgi:hypothetical protein
LRKGEFFAQFRSRRLWLRLITDEGISIFGPAELSEGLAEVGKGKTHDIEVAAFDARNVTAGASLYGVGSGLVEGLLGGEVAGELFVRERCEVHMGGFDEAVVFGVRQADERDAGHDGMGPGGQPREHRAGFVGGARLAKGLSFEEHDRVCGDDDGGAHGTGGYQLGFGVREALNQIVGGFAGDGSFINGEGEHREGQACGPKNVGAAG